MTDLFQHYELILLLILAFTAGYVDSIVGGGGLIQLPAFLIFAPQLPITFALGTNKFASFMGILASTFRYLQSAKVLWRQVLPALAACMIAAYLGAKMVSLLNKELLEVVILILLVAVAIYTFIRKNFGLKHQPRHQGIRSLLYSILTGTILGFYDGFFGPGTGSFLILAFVSVFGFDFLNASVSAKLINTGTNLAALAFFLYGGYVDFSLAIPAGLCNMAGSYLGAHTAIRKGSAFVRIFFLLIVIALIAKFSYDVF